MIEFHANFAQSPFDCGIYNVVALHSIIKKQFISPKKGIHDLYSKKLFGKGYLPQTLCDYLQKKGVKTKVLMLSATPVNNRLNDLKNQLQFITEGRDNSFKEYGINSIELTLRRAQNKFNKWLDLLDIKDEDFMPYTDASYKLSIRFEDFYKKNDGGYHYPFGDPIQNDRVGNKELWFYFTSKLKFYLFWIQFYSSRINYIIVPT